MSLLPLHGRMHGRLPLSPLKNHNYQGGLSHVTGSATHSKKCVGVGLCWKPVLRGRVVVCGATASDFGGTHNDEHSSVSLPAIIAKDDDAVSVSGWNPNHRSIVRDPKDVIPVPPTSITDVDPTRLLGYGADLEENHPGYGDDAYTQRRADIGRAATEFAIRVRRAKNEHESTIPHIQYTAEEDACWRDVLHTIKKKSQDLACPEYNAGLEDMLAALGPEATTRVPQLADVDKVLRSSPGQFRVRPVGGLLHPRSFLNALAFSTFHSTQYVRHPNEPFYTPEPDIIHELVGHLPLLMNETFADCVRHVGRASLLAPECDMWHLTKVYWYTVEFGVMHSKSVDRPLAYGAGVLSSIAELDNLAGAPDNGVTFLPLNPYEPLPKISYNDGVQKFYVSVQSLRDMERKLHTFADFCENLYGQGVSLKTWRHLQSLKNPPGEVARRA